MIQKYGNVLYDVLNGPRIYIGKHIIIIYRPQGNDY